MLTTLEKVKSYLAITTSDDDAVLTSLIAASSEAVEHYCSREFASIERTEIYDGRGSNCLILKNRPISAVKEVYDDEVGEFDQASLIPAFRYTYYPDEGVLRLYSSPFSTGIRNIKIVYTAGYPTIPPAVEQATNILVAQAFDNGVNSGDNFEYETKGRYVVDLDASTWPHQTRSLLSEFCEVRI